MSRNTSLLLIVWNVVLTALVAWGLVRSTTPTAEEVVVASDSTGTAVMPTPVIRDTAALKEGRIAYFHMDSLRGNYELIKEKDARFAGEVRRLEASLMGEQTKARARYQELLAKDRTYSTQAEIEKDDAEVRQLAAKLQEMQAQGEERMGRMEAEMLKEISKELEDFLKSYNEVAGFDYILSIQSGGQIWVGNKGLDITDDIVGGLNARYRANKGKK